MHACCNISFIINTCRYTPAAKTSLHIKLTPTFLKQRIQVISYSVINGETSLIISSPDIKDNEIYKASVAVHQNDFFLYNLNFSKFC